MTKEELQQQAIEGEDAYKECMIALMHEEVKQVGWEHVKRNTPDFHFIYDTMDAGKVICPYCKSEGELGRHCQRCKEMDNYFSYEARHQSPNGRYVNPWK
jgi:hypothetical protein